MKSLETSDALFFERELKRHPGIHRVPARRRGETLVTDDGIYLYSSYDPEKETHRYLKEYRKNPQEALVVIGCGGYFWFRELQREKVPICVIEFHPQMMIWSLEKLREVEGIHIVYYHPEHRPEEEIRRFFQKNYISSYSLVIPQGIRSWKKDLISRLNQRLRELAVEARQNQQCVAHFVKRWFTNLWWNVQKANRVGWIDQLQIPDRGEPVLLIGAGPRLKQNLPFLDKIQNKAWIVSTDTALPVLLAAGIEPDLCLAIDAGAQNLNHLITALKFRKTLQTILIADLVVSPEFVELYPGPVVFACTPFSGLEGERSPLLSLFFDDEKFPPFWESGGSVLHNAFSLALSFFRGEIVLVGADFAFGYLSHSPGTFPYEKWLNEESRFQIIKRYHNEEMRPYFLYREYLQQMRRLHPERKVWQISERVAGDCITEREVWEKIEKSSGFKGKIKKREKSCSYLKLRYRKRDWEDIEKELEEESRVLLEALKEERMDQVQEIIEQAKRKEEDLQRKILKELAAPAVLKAGVFFRYPLKQQGMILLGLLQAYAEASRLLRDFYDESNL